MFSTFHLQYKLINILKAAVVGLQHRWDCILFFQLYARDVFMTTEHNLNSFQTLANSTIFNRNTNIISFVSFNHIVSFLSNLLTEQNDITLKASVSLFIHRYLYDFILRDLSRLESELLNLLLMIGCGDHLWIGSLELWLHPPSKNQTRIVISVALQSFIISEIVRFLLSNVGEGPHSFVSASSPISPLFPSTKSTFAVELFEMFRQVVEKDHRVKLPFDCPSSILLIKCFDEIIGAKVASLSMLTSNLSSTQVLFDEKLSLLERLISFSLIRAVILEASKLAISVFRGDQSLLQIKENKHFQMCNLILQNNVAHKDALDGLRLFFLQELYRNEGTSTTQQFFNSHNCLECFPWIRFVLVDFNEII
jgi:hypothetical protein